MLIWMNFISLVSLVRVKILVHCEITKLWNCEITEITDNRPNKER